MGNSDDYPIHGGRRYGDAAILVADRDYGPRSNLVGEGVPLDLREGNGGEDQNGERREGGLSHQKILQSAGTAENAPGRWCEVTYGWLVSRMRGGKVELPPYRPKSSRRRFVWARLTGISVCCLSSMRNW